MTGNGNGADRADIDTLLRTASVTRPKNSQSQQSNPLPPLKPSDLPPLKDLGGEIFEAELSPAVRKKQPHYLPQNNSNSGRRYNDVKTALDDARLLKHRIRGLTYGEIAQAETDAGRPTTTESAYRRIQKAMKAIVSEPAEMVRKLELERLDLLWNSVIAKAVKGDLEAVRTALQIMDRRAKMQGLDAPVRYEYILEEARRIAGEFELSTQEITQMAISLLHGGPKGTMLPMIAPFGYEDVSNLEAFEREGKARAGLEIEEAAAQEAAAQEAAAQEAAAQEAAAQEAAAQEAERAQAMAEREQHPDHGEEGHGHPALPNHDPNHPVGAEEEEPDEEEDEDEEEDLEGEEIEEGAGEATAGEATGAPHTGAPHTETAAPVGGSH